MAVVVKTLTGSNSERYDKVPYRHIYILNDGNSGWIKINEAIELDVEKIDKVEDLIIKRLEWAISGSGSTFVILSHEKLSTDYIMRLMLSRIYTELQKKSSKKKIVFVNADSDTIVPGGSNELIMIQPPAGKIWRFIGGNVRAPAISGATANNHLFQSVIGEIYTAYTIVSANYNELISHLYGKAFGKTEEFSFSNSVPYIITYINNTDADQTQERFIRLVFEEEDEAE